MVAPGTYNAAPAGAAGPIRCRILDIAKPGTYIARAYDAENNWTNASVYDSTGHRICDDSGYCQLPAAGRYTMVLNGGGITSVIDNDSCELTGTAPYYVVLNENSGNAPGVFSVAFARVDNSPACPVLPRDPDGATVTTGSDHFAACFSIPADQHASAETFTWHRASGTGGGTLSVFSGTGLRYCGPTGPDADRTVTCTLPDGPAMVILETGAVDAAYQITHKDAATP